MNPLPFHRHRVFRIDDTSIRLDDGADAMLWTVAKEAAANWSSHKDSRQGAALAYYSVFSLGPIIVIAIAVAGFFFGRDAVSGQVASSTKDMLGDTGAQAIQAMLADAGRPREGLLATLLGLEHVPIICTHSLHDGSSWQPGGRSTVERMSRWRGRGEEWFVRQVFAEMPSAG